MPALGGRKPSELMAAMLETCPRGLPRVLLAKADHKDPKTLAHRRTSCGPSTTTATAAWRLCRKIQTRISWPPSPETGGVAVVPPVGRPAAAGEAAEAKRPPGCQSRRLPRRPGWPPASASSTGGTGKPPLPASNPAAGLETAVPGATKRGRPRRATPPHRRLNGPLGLHRRLVKHLHSSLVGSWFWSSSQES
jgi:hypothetical protein